MNPFLKLRASKRGEKSELRVTTEDLRRRRSGSIPRRGGYSRFHRLRYENDHRNVQLKRALFGRPTEDAVCSRSGAGVDEDGTAGKRSACIKKELGLVRKERARAIPRRSRVHDDTGSLRRPLQTRGREGSGDVENGRRTTVKLAGKGEPRERADHCSSGRFRSFPSLLVGVYRTLILGVLILSAISDDRSLSSPRKQKLAN